MTPREVNASILAYNNRQKKADLRAGIVASSIINVAPKSRRTKAIEPADLFPSLKAKVIYPKIEQSPEQQRNALIALAIASGARIIRRNKA